MLYCLCHLIFGVASQNQTRNELVASIFVNKIKIYKISELFRTLILDKLGKLAFLLHKFTFYAITCI